MNNYPDYEIVQKCLHQIEEQLGWGNAEKWHNEVFMELCEKILEHTQVRLSPTTLKRIWGKVNYKNAPSINTLNTLAQFANHKNWRDFKLSVATPKAPPTSKKNLSNYGVVMVLASIMTLLFISFYSMVGSRNVGIDTSELSKIRFASKPVTKGLPNSVIFDFDLNGLQSDNICIQQYWDPTKTIKIKSEQKQATGIYYLPGYFRAKLLVDGQILKEHDLFIKSENWIGTIDYQPIPKYVEPSSLQNENLSFPLALIKEIAMEATPLTSSFHLVNDFHEFSGDNFLLETSIRNVYRDKWAVCQKSKIVILGTKGAMIIPFSIPGCVSEIGVMLNDVYLNGKENDLSAFGFDFSDFRKIGISVENQSVKVAVDGEDVFSKRYQNSIGDLIGIRYRFLGAGEVKDLKIVGLDGRNISNVIVTKDKRF